MNYDIQTTFWMVLGDHQPTFRHTTFRSACEEAARLARLHPNVDFVVLKSVVSVKRTDVTWIEHIEANPNQTERDVPF